MIIKLVRHGESIANAGEIDHQDMPASMIPLSQTGVQQALEAGRIIGSDYVLKSLFYCSPYLRAKLTAACILAGSQACTHYEMAMKTKPFYEDPRLREQEYGFEKEQARVDQEEEHRKKHGWFHYRFEDGGESPADCYDRVSMFIEGLHRQIARKRLSRVLIVSHGNTIRCFVMRWLHLTVDQVYTIANPKNCDIITITAKDNLDNPMFVNGKWGVEGLRLRQEKKELVAI